MKDLISITEVSKYLGITTRTIRYYEELGLITPIQEGRGKRSYSRENIKKLMYIKELKEKGCPLKEIQELFGGKCCHEKFNILRAVHDENVKKIKELKEQNNKIQEELQIIEKLGDKNDAFEIKKFKKKKYRSLRERIPIDIDREIEAIWDFGHNNSVSIGHSGAEIIYVIEEENFKQKKWELFDYIYLDQGKKNNEIEEGNYLVMYTRNDIHGRKESMKLFVDYIEKNKLEIEGPFYMVPKANILCKSEQKFLVISEFRIKLLKK
ncbi:MerR family transcriptional regulator [Psychrilyobacter atlanticus]|uniref:MerR family transcriptional regulator n=1 Tax=Psychrilyobacter atlanticus TaxID=271091 RepID=UPI0003FC0EE6|nr:MerR family transcriptional regulator [Psychrilyobacter atlanticus]